MIEKEELKRMVERPGLKEDGTPIKLGKRKRVKRVAQKVVGGVVKNTLGRVGRFAGRRLLGRVPDTALEGSFQEEKPEEENKLLNKVHEVEIPERQPEVNVAQKDKDSLEKEILDKIYSDYIQSEDKAKILDAYKNGTMMKSDAELFEEMMEDKELTRQ